MKVGAEVRTHFQLVPGSHAWEPFFHSLHCIWKAWHKQPHPEVLRWYLIMKSRLPSNLRSSGIHFPSAGITGKPYHGRHDFISVLTMFLFVSEQYSLKTLVICSPLPHGDRKWFILIGLIWIPHYGWVRESIKEFMPANHWGLVVSSWNKEVALRSDTLEFH